MEVQDSKQAFPSMVRQICTSELPALRATMGYDYFQRCSTDEQAIQDRLEKSFDELYAIPVEKFQKRGGGVAVARVLPHPWGEHAQSFHPHVERHT